MIEFDSATWTGRTTKDEIFFFISQCRLQLYSRNFGLAIGRLPQYYKKFGVEVLLFEKPEAPIGTIRYKFFWKYIVRGSK